jgi:hypothetical protein
MWGKGNCMWLVNMKVSDIFRDLGIDRIMAHKDIALRCRLFSVLYYRVIHPVALTINI